MKRLYYANASDTPPQPPKNPSYGYPQDGDKNAKGLPTTLGSYWHHMITEEFMNVIEGAGIEPDENNLHQLADIFEDFRQRAFKAEGFAGESQDWANKAKEFAEAAQAEADSKVALVREAGEAQVQAVNAATAASQEEIEQKTAELEAKLQTLIAALDAKGGEQVNLVKLQAQEILDAIQLTKNQVEELVNSAGYSMRWLADAHEGINLTAALTPSENAKAGDHIINKSGEVYELIELRGTEIVLGPVLAVFGDVGPVGPAPEVGIEVAMIPSGSAATVERSGTNERPHFKLNIPKGDKGEAFVYSDFTEEQLEALRGPQGEKGDPLTFAELTEEQKAELKGEKGDPGETANLSNLIPKAGDRGVLKGWSHEQVIPKYSFGGESVTEINADSPDAMYVEDGDINRGFYMQGDKINLRLEAGSGVYDSAGENVFWIKTIRLGRSVTWSFSGSWVWVDGEAPALEAGDILIILYASGNVFMKLLKKNPS